MRVLKIKVVRVFEFYKIVNVSFKWNNRGPDISECPYVRVVGITLKIVQWSR